MTQAYPPPRNISNETTAFFLDVDGTLTEIVDDPSQVRIKPGVLAVLESLHTASGGALALISGRAIAQLDQMLHPLRLPSVGVHGLEWRLADGDLARLAFDENAHAKLVAELGRFAADLPGLLAEPKPGSVALHFRNRPELEASCLRFMQKQVSRDARLSLRAGKMVLELVFGRRTKGDAIARLMEQRPFAGRRPFFAGDDVSDEDGFNCVNDLNGISVKIGLGPTFARYRMSDPASLIAYLETMLDQQIGCSLPAT